MSAPVTKEQKISQGKEVLQKVGVEMAMIIEGEDTGLLPLNSYLMDLEDFFRSDTPSEITSGLAQARGWMDLILDGTGKFTAQSIHQFHQWHPWLNAALSSWEKNQAIGSFFLSGAGSKGGGAVAPSSAPAAAVAKSSPSSNEPSIQLNLAEDAELLREFLTESLELLQQIEQGLIVLESNPADAGTINAIFRAFHTFKGGAGFLHLGSMQNLAHDLETLLDAVRKSELTINSEIIDLILAGADALKHFTQEIGAQIQGHNAGQPIVVPTTDLIRRVKATMRGEKAAPAAASSPTPLPPPAPKEPGKTNVTSVVVEEMVMQVVPPEKEGGATPQPAAPTAVPMEAAGGIVKLDTWKLDNLVDLVGELVIAQSMVVQNPDVQGLTSRKLARSLRQLSRTTAELQRNAMSLRMIPIRGAFQKMSRLVRDLAAKQQKQVQLLLEGEDTELDRNIVEKLGDPLVHMIRNSVDHGLENVSDRRAAGKPITGTIRLSASHQRGGICIRIQDDGRGLNAERILAKAKEKGLVRQDQKPTEAEIYEMIFLPGFSTAEKVTDLSGRGVGMDVVRRNIENLRGKVEIHSVPGQGTTFTIILPLTLAIIDGLMVGVGDDRYIIPTLSVRESFRARPGMVTTIQERGEVVSVRGKQTPVLRVGPYLGRPMRAEKPEDGIMVVVESGDACRALLVDELIGKQEVVIKSLGQTFKNQHLLAGAAVLGDGSVGLIFDVDSLVKFADKGAPSTS